MQEKMNKMTRLSEAYIFSNIRTHNTFNFMYDYRVNFTPYFTDDELGEKFSSYIQVSTVLR
jgi:hypothetical protein